MKKYGLVFFFTTSELSTHRFYCMCKRICTALQAYRRKNSTACDKGLMQGEQKTQEPSYLTLPAQAVRQPLGGALVTVVTRRRVSSRQTSTSRLFLSLSLSLPVYTHRTWFPFTLQIPPRLVSSPVLILHQHASLPALSATSRVDEKSKKKK